LEREPILSMEQIDKAFPGVVALDEVDFKVYPKEIVALVGENGAGKSTLIKILTGVYHKDGGRITMEGQEIEPLSPQESFSLGLSVIHQEFNLVPQMMVFENVFLGREPRQQGATGDVFYALDKDGMRAETQRLLDQLGANFGPDAVVKNLGVAQQQLVEIAKALSLEARIIIMDEPTATLPQSDVEALFDIVRRLRDQGVSVVFITHRLEEIFAITDRVVVLRDGRNAGEMPISDATLDKVIALMVGRAMDQMFPKQEVEIGDIILSVKNLSRGKVVRNVSFDLRRGEILGFAGLVGAGRTETVRALFGIDAKDSGDILLEGKLVDLSSPRASVGAGLGLVPEDRKQQGLVLGMAVYKNITLPTLNRMTRALVIDSAQERALSERFVDQLRIRTPGIKQLVKYLSGGNQQKVVLAKWLAVHPEILILDEPTRGIDVGAKAEIHALMGQFAQEGMGVILISSELPELLGMCDRILVMAMGTVTGEFDRSEFDQEKIMARAVANVKQG
jgi:ribose transport system ATP-binding protein